MYNYKQLKVYYEEDRIISKLVFLFLLIVTCLVPACAQKGKPIITVLDFTLDEVSEAEMLETETARTLSAAAGDDLETLYDTWETAQQVATEGNANRNFILGASLAGAGIALSTVSLILFAQSSKDEGPEGTVAILPGPFVSTLRFSIRF